MAEDLIRYDVLVQEALRSVVRKVLGEAVRTGLPGDHHFYITFATQAPGVRISSRLRHRYPEEMTVVLQHQFWDLKVTEHAFEVGLSFGGVPEILLVPYSAIKGFFDPSVKFGFQLEPSKAPGGQETPAGSGPAKAGVPAPLPHAAEERAPALRTTPGVPAEPVNPPSPEAPAEADVPKVVSLDAFRKKS